MGDGWMSQGNSMRGAGAESPITGVDAEAPRRWSARWYFRIPLKWAVMVAVTLVVLFPNPIRLRAHIHHLRNLEALIEPAHPRLDAWAVDLGSRLTAIAEASHARADGVERVESLAESAPLAEGNPLRRDPVTAAGEDGGALPPYRVLGEVQKIVYERVAYEWDWNTWGMADYLPTVDEMFAAADARGEGHLREDCDGRAVIAASLMRRLGYDARIVTDLRHVWVATECGDWMGPGMAKALVSSQAGNRADLRAASRNLLPALTFGIAVFPWTRELILVVAGFILLYHRRMPARTAVVGALLLIDGWLFMRCHIPIGQMPGEGASWPGIVGLLHVIAACGVMCRGSWRARRSVPAAPASA